MKNKTLSGDYFVSYDIYSKGNDEHWFHSEGDKSDRFSLDGGIVGDAMNYILPNQAVEALVYTDEDEHEEIIGLKLPIKVELEVVEAPPSIKGNTSSGGDKVVVTNTGSKVTVPLFIKVGDTIAVNTETGEYSERVTKS